MAIIPVSVIVAALCFSIAPVSTDVFIMFIIYNAKIIKINETTKNLGGFFEE